MALVSLREVTLGYGGPPLIENVTLEIERGERIALLGRNGSGRSTTVKTIMGLVEGKGSIRWKDQEILDRKAFEIAHLGIGYVPENRDIFPRLTVHQNLMLGEKKGGRGSDKGQPRWSFETREALPAPGSPP